jgi:cytochrome c-type biogenesis protein
MFEAGILEAGFLLAALIALLAGALSFLSPCVLPIVPPYVAYMGGITLGETGGAARRRAVGAALSFVLGLSTVFLILGLAASALGRVFLQNQVWFNYAAGGVVVLFGLHFLHLIRIPFLERDMRLDAGDRGGSAFGAYLLGLAFAFGWTPCIGPQLGMILTLAAQEASLARGMGLLGVYALGLGVPFVLVAAFLPRLGGAMAWMRRHMQAVERAMGALLLIVGVLMLTGGFSRISWWLLETFPALGLVG